MQLKDYLDSTYLKTPEQSGLSESDTWNEVLKLTNEAIENKIFSVMIRPNYVSKIRAIIDNSTFPELQLGTVISFPEGNNSVEEKLMEAQNAIFDGADELDFVLNYRKIKSGNKSELKSEIVECSRWVLEKGIIIKWIIETAALSNDEICEVSSLIAEIITKYFEEKYWNKVFVKSSTGFYKTENNKPNGATVESILLMLEYAKPLPVKASGGIKTQNDALKMIELGVKRIGTSSAVEIIKGENSQFSDIENSY